MVYELRGVTENNLHTHKKEGEQVMSNTSFIGTDDEAVLNFGNIINFIFIALAILAVINNRWDALLKTVIVLLLTNWKIFKTNKVNPK